MGVGMIVCGVITDRLTKKVAIRKWTTALVFTTISLVALPLGFAQEPGTLQLVLIAVGRSSPAGTTGPAGAMVANLTPASIRATAFGTSPWPTTSSVWPPARSSSARSPTRSASWTR